jgi:hypothetical protein
MPAPRIDYLLGQQEGPSKDRQDFDDLLRRTAAFFNIPARPAQQHSPQEATNRAELLEVSATQ